MRRKEDCVRFREFFRRTKWEEIMSGDRDNRDRRKNQFRAFIFLLAVVACFAVCIFLTSGSTAQKKTADGDVTAVPAQAAGAGTETDFTAEQAETGSSAGAEESAQLAGADEPEGSWGAETPAGESIMDEAAATGESIADEAAAAGDSIADEAAAADESITNEAAAVWDLDALPNDLIPYGYVRENRDESNVPTDMFWYESQWGQYNVDWIQDTRQNIIYLTMDDGFPNETTAVILDILREKDVKAVFFLTKQFVDGMPEIVQRMIDEGHQIGNHSCNHPTMPDLSVEEQTAEIMNLQDQVREQFGYDMKYFRFPEGAFSERSLGLVDNLGLKTVFWSYAYNDYSEEQPPVEESLQLALGELHPGAVYLLHANSTTNAAFLADWIDACRARGFEFGIYPEAAH